MDYPWKKLSAQEKLRRTLQGVFVEGKKYGPPPPGESYELGPEDWQDLKPKRVSGDGPLLNSKGDPAGIDKLILSRETLRNLQFQNPDEMVGPPWDEEVGVRQRVHQIQRDMVESNHARCGNVVERGVEHTKMLICNIYLGLGGDWDPPKP